MNPEDVTPPVTQTPAFPDGYEGPTEHHGMEPADD